MFRNLLQVFLALIAVLANLGFASAEKRVALVVGNSAYEHVVPLPNPIADAGAIAASLKRLNFDVTLLTDQSSLGMRRALRDFARKSARSDIAVIYFAGHGIEIEGRNFLIPTDAELKQDVDVEFETISLNDILRSVRGAKGLRMVLLDACRNNPFAQSMVMTNTTRSIGRGLARVEPDVGTLVSYAAKQGTVAQDGDGKHSPYTQALLANLEQPGLEVQFLFRKVRDAVLRDTNRQQEPFTYGSLPGKQIYLRAPEKKAPAADQPSAAELAYWNSVRTSKNAAVIQSYLKTYPKGRFVLLAEALLSQVKAEQEKANAEKLAKVKAARKDAEETKRRAKERAEAETRQKAELAAALAAAQAAQEKARLAAEAAEKKRKRQLQAWLAIQTSRDQRVLQRYIADYPDSPFIGLASTRLESLKRQKLAALQPQNAPAVATQEPADASGEQPELSPRDLALAMQQQLARLGCNPGRPDGDWGNRSRRALKAFSRHGKVKLASVDPSPETLDRLEKQKGRVCPLICGRREVLKGNRCVAKTCRRGEEFNRSGRCVKSKDKRQLDDARKRKAAQQKKAKTPKRSSKKASCNCKFVPNPELCRANRRCSQWNSH